LFNSLIEKKSPFVPILSNNDADDYSFFSSSFNSRIQNGSFRSFCWLSLFCHVTDRPFLLLKSSTDACTLHLLMRIRCRKNRQSLYWITCFSLSFFLSFWEALCNTIKNIHTNRTFKCTSTDTLSSIYVTTACSHQFFLSFFSSLVLFSKWHCIVLKWHGTNFLRILSNIKRMRLSNHIVSRQGLCIN